jgi:hypothetical protein
MLRGEASTDSPFILHPTIRRCHVVDLADPSDRGILGRLKCLTPTVRLLVEDDSPRPVPVEELCNEPVHVEV